MAGQDLPFFKFVQPLIDAGIWARMSPAARALYPVLLRFSDRFFGPVYPGSLKLLELTGFKQKSSLRKAREELVRLGLVSLTKGSGRSNTVYHFRFDWAPPSGALQRPSEGGEAALLGSSGAAGEVAPRHPPYNQIQISINNTQKSRAPKSEWAELEKRFGADETRLARSELELAGLPADATAVEKLLSGKSRSAGLSWGEIRRFLRDRISPGSLAALEEAFLREERDLLVFRSNLPEHLKHLLGKIAPHACFEAEAVLAHREIWNQAGNDG